MIFPKLVIACIVTLFVPVLLLLDTLPGQEDQSLISWIGMAFAVTVVLSMLIAWIIVLWVWALRDLLRELL